jgi:Carboxypeptidase regulatory-like domain
MKLLIISGCLVILSGLAFAQTSQSQKRIVLTGKVFDINHAVIFRSEILARNSEGNEYTTTTNSEGAYKIELPKGVYKVKASAAGFCAKRVELRSDRQRQLDFVLNVSDSAEPCAAAVKKDRPIRKPEIFRSIAE